MPLGHIQWQVPFSPGKLEAIAYHNGQKTVTSTVATAGTPAGILLTADRKTIKADGHDLSFITIDVKDKAGNFVPKANNLIKVEVLGGKLLGLCSGDPQNHQSPSLPAMKAFNGKLLAIVQSDQHKGKITVKASAEGIPPGRIELKKK